MQLNLIGDAGAKNLRDFYQKSLAENKHPANRYKANFVLGLLAWRESNIVEFKKYLESAATEFIAIFTRDDAPEYNSTSMILPVLVVMNFGGASEKLALIDINKMYWLGTAREPNALSCFINALIGYIENSSEEKNLANLSYFDIKKLDDADDYFYKTWIDFFIKGIGAVYEENEVKANQQLRNIVEYHQVVATEGEWRNVAEGLLSLWGLTLKNIARGKNIHLNFRSPYLPEF